MAHPTIILTTLNARYIHASLGLRYLFANMGDLQKYTELLEFTIKRPINEIADQILEHSPTIVGFGVYIWNISETEQVIHELKKRNPELIIVVGGPEVSYEYETASIIDAADYLITGTADLMFASVCHSIISRQPDIPKVVKAPPISLADLKLPYSYYRDSDLKNRVIYVEASRGCPFKCEFCLSSLDKTAYPFELDLFLTEMDALYERGARTFKFVDRTFNLKVASSVKILEFFLTRIDYELFLHFELIPDNLPDALKALLIQFPKQCLQFEIGIQSFTPEVQTLISRRQNDQKACDNILWLKKNTGAHLHTDLIFGLPGESLESFAASFNKLVALGPHEIQLGILKRLKGTPISRHSNTYSLEFNSNAPYEILSTSLIDQHTMMRIKQFAKYWDMFANSGRFKHALAIICKDDPFTLFLQFSDFLYEHFSRTHSIHLNELFDAAFIFFDDDNSVKQALSLDYQTMQQNQRDSSSNKYGHRQHQHA